MLAIRASATHVPQRVKNLILPYVRPLTTVEVDPLNKPAQISWVLASHDPCRLAAFYAALFGVCAEQGFSTNHWVIAFSEGSQLELYKPSRKRPFPTRGQHLAPCLRLRGSEDPLEQLTSRLPGWCALGASIAEPPRREPFGAECWLLDPEDNAVLVVVPTRSDQ